MSETNPNVVWTYDVTDTSQDRHAPRTGIRAPLSSELTGVDPLYEGGLRPFSGFRQVHFFQLTSADHKVTDVFSGDFSIGTGYGYYFVYRVQDPVSSGGTSSDGSTIGKVYVDYWNSFTGDWTRKVLLVSGVPTSPAFDPVEGRQMNVVAVGRFIYVFIEGTRPVLFFVNGEAPYDQTIEDQTGPGKRPTLKSPENMSSLGSIVSTGVDDRPAAGGIYLTTTPPSGLMLGLGTGTSSSDGTITGQKDANCRFLEPGDYSFAFQLLDSVTGRKSALSEVAQARKEDFATGSSTLTAAPQISKYAALEICYDRTLFDQALVWRSVKTQDAGGIFVANILLLDRIINLDEFKTSNSISSSSSGEERLSQSIYYYELEDKQLVFQDTFQDETTFDEKMPYGGSAHWFDNTMLVSKIRSQAPSTEVEPRGEDSFRGIGETRYSSVYEYSPELFPPSNRLNPSLPSNNILLFRQIGQTVVGFSKDRQYLFRKDGTFLRMVEIHEGFGVINDKAADSVGSMVYFVTTKGVKSVDVSGQLDTVQAINHTILNSWSTSLASVSCAHDAGMSSFFVFNSEMDELVIFCMNTGKVCRIEDCPFEGVFRGVWPDNFTWDFEELRANDGIGNETYRNQLVSRAMFWTNPSLSVYCPVYLVDYTRQRLKGYGPGAAERQITLLPVDGDAVWEVHVAFTMGTDLYLKADSSKLLALSAYLAPGAIEYRHKVYVVWSANRSLIGRSATISFSQATSPRSLRLVSGEASALYGLAAGDIVAISPVVFRWVGTPLWVPTPGPIDGKEPDFHQLKSVESILCAFCDVSGSSLTENHPVNRYAGLLFRGNEVDPLEVSPTVDAYDDLAESIVTTQVDSPNVAAFGTAETTLGGRYGLKGTVLTPGVEVICSDLDFTLVSVHVTGAIHDSVRSKRRQV